MIDPYSPINVAWPYQSLYLMDDLQTVGLLCGNEEQEKVCSHKVWFKLTKDGIYEAIVLQ